MDWAMRHRGLNNPWPKIWVSLVVLIGGIWALWSGAVESQAADEPFGLPLIKVSLGTVAILIGAVTVPAFLSRVLVLRRISMGRGEIARWTVSAADLDLFRANDKARNALGPDYDNDWRVPALSPANGIEVVFVQDGVTLDKTYFPLATLGQFIFAGVQILPENPLAIEFGIVAASLNDTGLDPAFRYNTVLRIPASRLARPQAVQVYDFFRRVDAREIISNEHYFRNWMRCGLIATPLGFAAAGYGYWRAFHGGEPDDIALFALVAGVMAGLCSPLLALIAWFLGQQQRQR